VALAAAAIVLVIAAWFDNTVIREALHQATGRFEVSVAMVLTALGSVLVAGSALLLGVLAWRSASVVVGIAYVVVGGFFAALPWLRWTFAAVAGDRSLVLPEPLASVLNSIYSSTIGSLNAAETIGAAMLVAGTATVSRWLRGRADSASRAEVAAPTPLADAVVDRSYAGSTRSRANR